MKYSELPTREVTNKSGSVVERHVVLDAYWVWRDGLQHRWAVIDWPDNGLGTRNHGAARSLAAAVLACKRHRKLCEVVG